jgi:hypothetical protein
MVTITVGIDFDDDQSFVLPREYLTDVSEFFENIFKGTFHEVNEKTLTLSDVEPVTFQIFIEWLHRRKFLNGEGEEYDGARDGEADESRFTELMNLYIFSDQFDVPQLRRDVLDTFNNYQNNCPVLYGTTAVTDAYNQLPQRSPMLRLLVDSYIDSWMGISEERRGFASTTFQSSFCAK